MKKVLLFIVLVTIAKTYSQTSTAWQLVWEDDFNRKDIFSTAVWSKIPRCEKIDWCNTMSDHKSLFKIKKGNLILSGKPNPHHKTDPNQYITGGVFTKGKMYFTFGRIEVRCKLEGVQGSWPAIWMLPQSIKWPKGGEMDILERLNNDAFVYQTVHSPYTQNGNTEYPKHSATAPIRPTDYNVYAVEWDKEAVRLYVNDSLSLTYPRIPEKETEGQYPFTQEPYYLLIDMQLGGSWVGDVKPFKKPVKMYIDWVRYYQKTD